MPEQDLDTHSVQTRSKLLKPLKQWGTHHGRPPGRQIAIRLPLEDPLRHTLHEVFRICLDNNLVYIFAFYSFLLDIQSFFKPVDTRAELRYLAGWVLYFQKNRR